MLHEAPSIWLFYALRADSLAWTKSDILADDGVGLHGGFAFVVFITHVSTSTTRRAVRSACSASMRATIPYAVAPSQALRGRHRTLIVPYFWTVVCCYGITRWSG